MLNPYPWIPDLSKSTTGKYSVAEFTTESLQIWFCYRLKICSESVAKIIFNGFEYISIGIIMDVLEGYKSRDETGQ